MDGTLIYRFDNYIIPIHLFAELYEHINVMTLVQSVEGKASRSIYHNNEKVRALFSKHHIEIIIYNNCTYIVFRYIII